MADDDNIPQSVEEEINKSLDEDELPKAPKRKIEPSYRMLGDSKIPVSKQYGKVWMSRKDQGEKVYADAREAWEEAIRYFDNDQMQHRQAGEDFSAGNTLGNRRLNNNLTETENVVFANVTTMVPALYARNPKAEFTSHIEDDAMKKLATILERLVNVLGGKKVSPGINLKPRAKRAVVIALLTNRVWLKLNWIFREDSNEAVIQEIQQLSDALTKAKTTKEIEEVEGKIQALEETISVLNVPGPIAELKLPDEIIVDPESKMQDATDAKWIMERTFISTRYLQAKFAKKKSGSEEYASIYKPTHVMRLSKNDADEGESDSFSLFEPEETYKSAGYQDQEAYENAQLTRCWYVWDRTTRRVFLYNDADWTWPVWVWDDPLQLDVFAPYYALYFFETPTAQNSKGEVTYYLDQQDAINEMTDEERRARRWARRNVFFNSNHMDQVDVDAVLNGDDGTARGVDVPDGMTLNDVIFSVVPPSMQYKELFDKESKYQAIDRISSVGEVLRGAQFKTNTTNDAVQANVGAQNIRLDEKSDQIEDWIGQIYWGLAQLCLMYMPVEQVVSLVGEEARQVWRNMTPEEIESQLSMTVVGGSTKKPTSAAKKEEALELGQVLGQFVNAAPGPVLKVMLKTMEAAFDEITIKEEDWEEITAAVTQQAQAQAAPPQGGQTQQGVPPTNGGAQQPDQAQIEQLLAQIPPEMKPQIVQLIQQGVPASQAIQQVMGQIQGQPVQ